jgi:hypothetical protein
MASSPGVLYGVSLGRMFFGESMFAHRTDASKIALAALVAFCRDRGIATIDCQQRTAHLASFGGRELPRTEFMARLGMALAMPAVVDWTYDLRCGGSSTSRARRRGRRVVMTHPRNFRSPRCSSTRPRRTRAATSPGAWRARRSRRRAT